MDPPYVGHLWMVGSDKKGSVRIMFNFRLKEGEAVMLECILKSRENKFGFITRRKKMGMKVRKASEEVSFPGTNSDKA